MKTVSFEKKKKKSIKKQITGIECKGKNLLHCRKKFERVYSEVRNYHKVRDHFHYADKYRSSTQQDIQFKI